MFEEGTVLSYHAGDRRGVIGTGDRSEISFSHKDRCPLGASPAHEFLPPKPGQRILYLRDEVEPWARLWLLPDEPGIKRLNRTQMDLAAEVLGETLQGWHIWDDAPNHASMPTDREYFGAVKHPYTMGGGVRGTFNQALQWCRWELARQGNKLAPKFQPWPDMPRYSVRRQTGDDWFPMGLALYTKAQAKAYVRYLTELSHQGARVLDLWPAAPPLSTTEAGKVLAASYRQISGGGRRMKWVDRTWQPSTVVAEGELDAGGWHVTVDGHTYQGDDAALLSTYGYAA